MQSQVIKEFLVRLGYKVDATSERKFTDGVEKATKTVNALGTTLKALVAGGVMVGAVRWLDKMANSLEGLYYQSQRSNASAKNLLAIGYAADQMGSSAASARNEVQGLYQWIRNNPGAERLLQQNLGITTRGANGELRDTTELIQDIGKRLADMDAAHANVYANLFGISLPTLMALKQGLGEFTDDYRKMLEEAGLDTDKAAKSSHNFMVTLRSLGAAFHIVGLRVASSLVGSGGAGGALDRFRHLLLSHSAQITRVIDRLVDFAGKLFLRLIDWLDRLDWDKVSDGIGKVIQWLGSIDWSGLARDIKDIVAGLGGWKTVLIALGGLLAANLILPITGLIGLLGRLIPMLASAAAGISGLGAAAVGVGVAGVGGWAAGRAINNRYVDGTRGGNAIGRFVASIMAGLGSDEARKAILQNESGLGAHVTTDRVKQLVNLDRVRQAANAQRVQDLASLDRVRGAGSLPKGIRNNNPGNLRTGPGGSFGIYGTAAEGLTALQHQLMLYFTGKSRAAGFQKLQSVRDIISTYAPKNENNTAAYIQAVAKGMGISADAKLNLNDPGQMAALMRNIVLHENGQNPYSAEMFRAAAGGNSQSGTSPTLNSDTKIYVQGSSDPMATAQRVRSEQDGVNQRLVRNFRTVTS